MKRSKDESLLLKYNNIFEDYVKKGYLRKIPAEHADWLATSSDGWYLPHFPVIREDRMTTKIRIVFDAAAKFHGKGLNDEIQAHRSVAT